MRAHARTRARAHARTQLQLHGVAEHTQAEASLQKEHEKHAELEDLLGTVEAQLEAGRV